VKCREPRAKRRLSFALSSLLLALLFSLYLSAYSMPNSAATIARAESNPLSGGRKPLLRGIFKTKNLDDILAAAQEEGHKLKRTLGPINITLLGIGAIIGAGIFATVGTAAADDASRPGAGPSLMVSFGITAIVCAFTELCYAEMAAMVPISGSGLYLLLRDVGGTGRVDHRLGLDPRIRNRQRRGGLCLRKASCRTGNR
jgi:hypothetical protein